MISLLLYSREKKELKYMKETSRSIYGRLSEETSFVNDFWENSEVVKFLKEHPIVDISCLDITANGGLGFAETVHQNNASGYIILLAVPEISPITYMRPTIMASSLLLRPLTSKAVDNAFREAFREHLRKFKKNDTGNLEISTRDGRQLVPFEQINFLEAREKKVIVNTDYAEFSFYSTLDKLSEKLPQGFIRCHRGFIISADKADRIVPSQNIIILRGGCEIPVSRSYKSCIKELREWTVS